MYVCCLNSINDKPICLSLYDIPSLWNLHVRYLYVCVNRRSSHGGVYVHICLVNCFVSNANLKKINKNTKYKREVSQIT
jgi:hypothetical protein